MSCYGVIVSAISLKSQADVSPAVAAGMLLIFPSVTSAQYASFVLPSAPVQRSPIVQYGHQIFIGCKEASSQLGDIVAVNMADG